MISRSRTVSVSVVAVAALLAAAACSPGPRASTAATPSTTVITVGPSSASAPTSATSSAPTTTPSTTSSTTTDGDGVDGGTSIAPCPTSVLRAEVVAAPGGASAGSRHLRVRLRNTGSGTCTLTGYPGVSFVGDGNGTQLGAAADRTGEPTPTARLTPGAAVYAPLAVAEAGNFGDCTATVADGFRVYPPNQRDALFVRVGGIDACRSAAIHQLRVGAVR